MNRRPGWILLAVLAGCGDDDGGGLDSGRPSEFDASVMDDGSATADGGGSTLDGSSSGAGAVGDACGDDGDCSTGQCEQMLFGALTLPGGYCSETCAAGACGVGADCIELVSLCAKSCGDDTDCRVSEGYSCAQGLTGTGGGGVCIPPVDSLLDGGFALPDGGFTLPDGGFTLPDGGFTLPDGDLPGSP